MPAKKKPAGIVVPEKSALDVAYDVLRFVNAVEAPDALARLLGSDEKPDLAAARKVLAARDGDGAFAATDGLQKALGANLYAKLAKAFEKRILRTKEDVRRAMPEIFQVINRRQLSCQLMLIDAARAAAEEWGCSFTDEAAQEIRRLFSSHYSRGSDAIYAKLKNMGKPFPEIADISFVMRGTKGNKKKEKEPPPQGGGEKKDLGKYDTVIQLAEPVVGRLVPSFYWHGVLPHSKFLPYNDGTGGKLTAYFGEPSNVIFGATGTKLLQADVPLSFEIDDFEGCVKRLCRLDGDWTAEKWAEALVTINSTLTALGFVPVNPPLGSFDQLVWELHDQEFLLNGRYFQSRSTVGVVFNEIGPDQRLSMSMTVPMAMTLGITQGKKKTLDVGNSVGWLLFIGSLLPAGLGLELVNLLTGSFANLSGEQAISMADMATRIARAFGVQLRVGLSLGNLDVGIVRNESAGAAVAVGADLNFWLLSELAYSGSAAGNKITDVQRFGESKYEVGIAVDGKSIAQAIEYRWPDLQTWLAQSGALDRFEVYQLYWCRFTSSGWLRLRVRGSVSVGDYGIRATIILSFRFLLDPGNSKLSVAVAGLLLEDFSYWDAYHAAAGMCFSGDLDELSVSFAPMIQQLTNVINEQLPCLRFPVLLPSGQLNYRLAADFKAASLAHQGSTLLIYGTLETPGYQPTFDVDVVTLDRHISDHREPHSGTSGAFPGNVPVGSSWISAILPGRMEFQSGWQNRETKVTPGEAVVSETPEQWLHATYQVQSPRNLLPPTNVVWSIEWEDNYQTKTWIVDPDGSKYRNILGAKCYVALWDDKFYFEICPRSTDMVCVTLRATVTDWLGNSASQGVGITAMGLDLISAWGTILNNLPFFQYEKILDWWKLAGGEKPPQDGGQPNNGGVYLDDAGPIFIKGRPNIEQFFAAFGAEYLLAMYHHHGALIRPRASRAEIRKIPIRTKTKKKK